VQNRVPDSWVGRQVEAQILESGGFTVDEVPKPVIALHRIGTLEDVNELGMLASLSYDPDDEEVGMLASLSYDPDDEEEEQPISAFYPWGSVLWLRLVEES
jgi:hypothetical protein